MRKEKKLPDILLTEELELIFASSKTLKQKAIFMIAYSSGLRVGEVIRLKVTDIDSTKMQIRIRQSKRKKDRYTLLSKRTLICLRDYYRQYRPNDWLFYSRKDKSKHIVRSTIEKDFKATVKTVGINKKVTPHSLRHAFASHLLENGTDIYTIKTLLGHSSLRSTQIYLQLSPSCVFSVKSPLDKEAINE